jgi:hypothetical protein
LTHCSPFSRSKIGRMSWVKDGRFGAASSPPLMAVSRIRSHMVRTDLRCGPKLGGAHHHPGRHDLERHVPFSLTLAVTGPSEMSSYQPSLLAKVMAQLPSQDADLP